MNALRNYYIVDCRLRDRTMPGDTFWYLHEARAQHKANKKAGFASTIWKASYTIKKVKP